MNYLSHHEVARVLTGGENHGAMLGAMVPDFLGMFGTKLVQPNYLVRRGIALHHATDKVFDGLAAVRSLEADMRESLGSLRDGNDRVNGRVVRAMVAVGKDLLFDGIYFRDEDIKPIEEREPIRAYQQTMSEALAEEVKLTADTYNLNSIAGPVDKWRSRFEAHFNKGIPRYDDVRIVAQRIHNRLSITKMAFGESLIEPLAAALTEYQARVFEIVPSVHNELFNRLEKDFSEQSFKRLPYNPGLHYGSIGEDGEWYPVINSEGPFKFSNIPTEPYIYKRKPLTPEQLANAVPYRPARASTMMLLMDDLPGRPKPTIEQILEQLKKEAQAGDERSQLALNRLKDEGALDENFQLNKSI
jgi:hypothetical protein